MNKKQIIVMLVGIAVFVFVAWITSTIYPIGEKGTPSYTFKTDYGPLIVRLASIVLATASLIYTLKDKK